jgi:hypothetical protein
MKNIQFSAERHLPLVISILAMAFTGWQSWRFEKEKDTPLQALVYQTQMLAVQSLTENARISCNRRICSDYGNPAKEKMDICKGNALDDAFGKVEDASNAMKLVAAPEILNIVDQFGRMHQRHAFNELQIGRGPSDTPDTEPDAIKWALYKKCESEIDGLINDFRSTMGLSRLSTELLHRLGQSAQVPVRSR